MVKGITYRLVNDDLVQERVGTKANDNTKYKVFSGAAGQEEKAPYIVVRQSGKIPFECKDIVATTFQYRYDVHSYHKNYEGAEELDLAVIAALPLQDNTVINGVVFQEIRHVNTIDVFNEDYMLHGKISSFEAIVNEDQAT